MCGWIRRGPQAVTAYELEPTDGGGQVPGWDQQALDAGLPGSQQHRVAVGVEGLGLQVCVRVDEPQPLGARSGTQTRSASRHAGLGSTTGVCAAADTIRIASRLQMHDLQLCQGPRKRYHEDTCTTLNLTPRYILRRTSRRVCTSGLEARYWDLVRIREEAVIGVDCILGRGVYINSGVTIGDRVKIQNNALVYHGTTVEAGVFIGPGAILTNDRFPRSVTVDGRLAKASDWTVSQIRLSEGCSIGAGAVIVAGCDVGRYATVGAGTVLHTIRSRPRADRREPGGTSRMGMQVRSAPYCVRRFASWSEPRRPSAMS